MLFSLSDRLLGQMSLVTRSCFNRPVSIEKQIAVPCAVTNYPNSNLDCLCVFRDCVVLCRFVLVLTRRELCLNTTSQ